MLSYARILIVSHRRIDDDSARFKFDSCVVLWTNHNSALSIATNLCASSFIDNRLRQNAIFVFVKMAKFKMKRLFSVYFDSLLYKTNRFHVAVRLFSVPLFWSYHILTSSVIYYLTEARQHGIHLLTSRTSSDILHIPAAIWFCYAPSSVCRPKLCSRADCCEKLPLRNDERVPQLII